MTLKEYRESKFLEKQTKKLANQEQKVLSPQKQSFLEKKTAPFLRQVTEKTPPKARAVLEKAFRKGFLLVFDKGTGFIEKTCAVENKKAIFRDAEAKIEQEGLTRSQLFRLDWQALGGTTFNTLFSTAEGAVLGVLGIGLPDIPVVIAIILKSLYEACLSFGFDHRNPEERLFMLSLICAATSETPEESHYYARLADNIGWTIDHCTSSAEQIFPLDSAVEQASAHLCTAMLESKVIQGIPIAGVYGALYNQKVVSRIGKLAFLKYKKRWLTLTTDTRGKRKLIPF